MRRQHRRRLTWSEWSSSHSTGEAPWPGLDPDYRPGSCCRTAPTTMFQTGRARTTDNKEEGKKDINICKLFTMLAKSKHVHFTLNCQIRNITYYTLCWLWCKNQNLCQFIGGPLCNDHKSRLWNTAEKGWKSITNTIIKSTNWSNSLLTVL